MELISPDSWHVYTGSPQPASVHRGLLAFMQVRHMEVYYFSITVNKEPIELHRTGRGEAATSQSLTGSRVLCLE